MSRRRVPVDVWGFLAIAAVIVVTHARLVRHGMVFGEPSWLFHFAKRAAVGGDVPYRDFVFPDGPLAIYVDAAFQGVFGGKYYASLYAALFVEVLRVFVVWAIARRVAGVAAASLLAAFCAFDPIFGPAHHASAPYAQLFVGVAGLALLLAARGGARWWFGIAGLAIGAIAAAQPTTWLAATVMLGAVSAAMLGRGTDTGVRRALAAIWIGNAAAVTVLAVLLAVAGALGAAVEQTIVDAPARAGSDAIGAVLDALSGGALVSHEHAWWSGLLVFLALPAAAIAGVLYAARRDGDVPVAAIGLLIAPLGVVLLAFGRSAHFELLTDLPRAFLLAVTIVAAAWPERLRAWFGIEPLVAIGLGALPLAADWAAAAATAGRGGADASSLVVGAMLVVLASPAIAAAARRWLCGALAASAVIGLAVALHADVPPFARPVAVDGTLAETSHRSRDRALHGLRISRARQISLDWLRHHARRRRTCFVDGDLPIVYTFFRCKNPTRLDSTAPAFHTAADARAALATLHRAPPELIFVQTHQPHRGLHLALEPLLRTHYQLVDLGRNAFGPELTPRAAAASDRIDAVAVYLRRDEARR